MRKIVIGALSVLLLACSGTPGIEAKEPTQTVEIIPTADPKPELKEPELKELEWKPFNTETRKMLTDTGYCALLYFGSNNEKFGEGSADMEETFKDQNVVKLISGAFVPVRFPVDECLEQEDCIDVLKGLDIKGFPTTVLVFSGEESVMLYGEGYMNAKRCEEFLFFQKELYDECKSLMKGTND
ncbi:hypothetical protein LCGC14_0533370 [marine sediment metagenome]|uniref:Thioredoxin domain-containing protein n=1 Tax=marine sediment metagenome TaxID=412755 RepID=A0A0F9SDC3_9ZZZZ